MSNEDLKHPRLSRDVEQGHVAHDGYTQGVPTSRFITPGGNPIDSSQPAFPIYHRK